MVTMNYEYHYVCITITIITYITMVILPSYNSDWVL